MCVSVYKLMEAGKGGNDQVFAYNYKCKNGGTGYSVFTALKKVGLQKVATFLIRRNKYDMSITPLRC